MYQLVWLFSTIILMIKLFLPAPGLDVFGIQIWLQVAFAILLYLFVFMTAFGIGKKISCYLQDLSDLEQGLLSLLFGFAILSYGIFLLGLIGILYPVIIFLWLGISGFFASFQWKDIIEGIQRSIKSIKQQGFRDFGLFEYLLLAIIGSLLIILPIISLVPVRDYDALMYHLEIPRQFLDHGRIYFNPESWRSAYPMLAELVFSIGIIFHLEPITQLFSLTFCIIFFLSVYSQ